MDIEQNNKTTKETKEKQNTTTMAVPDYIITALNNLKDNELITTRTDAIKVMFRDVQKAHPTKYIITPQNKPQAQYSEAVVAEIQKLIDENPNIELSKLIRKARTLIPYAEIKMAEETKQMEGKREKNKQEDKLCTICGHGDWAHEPEGCLGNSATCKCQGFKEGK